jgi:hypothetical protein
MDLACKNNEKWDKRIISANTFNRNNRLTIIRINQESSSILIACEDILRATYANTETSLVKIVLILRLNTISFIRGFISLYKCLNSLRFISILALYS